MTMKFAVSSQWLAQTAASSSSSSSSQQITIRDATHGRLQCTLRSQPGRPIRRLTLQGTVLVGEAHAAADTTTTSDDDAATTMVWDLTRGVMAYELTGVGIRSACCAAAAGTTTMTGATNPQQHQVYVLKQKDNTDKLIVYEYNSAGAVVRKVKAGKTSSSTTDGKLQLFVTSDLFVVVQHEETAGTMSWRMIDLTTGSKRAKASTGDVQQLIVASTQHDHGQTNHHSYAFGIVASAANHHHKTLFCLNLTTGNVVDLPSNLTSQNVQDLQVAERRDGGGFYLLLNNSQLYILARGEVDGDDDDDSSLIAATARLYCTMPTVDNDNVVYILHSDRLLVVDGHSGTVQRVYLDWATLPQEVAATATTSTTDEDAVMNDADEEPIGKDKRKSGSGSGSNDKVAVLGPGQAGSMSKADVEHPVNKKARSSITKSSVVSVSESSSTDHNNTTAAVMVDELTLAERLRQLEQAADELESSEDDTNNMEKQHKDLLSSPSTAAVITTESLYQLIAQGLQSNDRNLVETALRVADASVIRATCRELNASQTQQLLYWLTDRIAARPNRGERLAAWLSCLIPTVASADDLKPLHNLLQDRLQVYPRLMHLQGRLQYLENSDEGQ
jgi:Dip2/Utp12 Family